jgi:hypothetical protein
MILLAVWQVVARFKCDHNSNWPLVFYICLLGYSQANPEVFRFHYVAAATVVAWFLRYEFLGKFFRWTFVTVEMLALAYFTTRLAEVLVI